MVLDSSPVAKPPPGDRASRPLAYQQAISQPREQTPQDEEAAASDGDVPPFETVTTETESTVEVVPPDGPDSSQDVPAVPDEGAAQDGLPWSEPGDQSQDMAAVPPPASYDGEPAPPGAEQWDDGADDQWGTDDAEQWDDERGPPWADGAPADGPPGQADQWGDDQGATEWADENTEEWVEVIISGAAMRSTASEDAPMLFAFPYGRNLKVISRYEGWVEVTDPQSAATGWMQAHAVSPVAAQQPYGQDEAYYDEPPRRGGWFRRNTGGFTDMINRALGGGF